MFRKKAALGTLSLLGNKERKKLREQALKAFPLLVEADFDLLLPPKEEISVAKLQFPPAPAGSTAGGNASPSLTNSRGMNRGTVYLCRGEPVFFEVNGVTLPSVYTLWKCPDLLPTFVVHAPVSSFILKGADLMLPGVIWSLTLDGLERQRAKKREHGDGRTLPEGIEVMQLWSVRVAGNPLPFAVGCSTVAAVALQHLAGKGKALEMAHAFGDGLWQLGSQSAPSKLFTPKQVMGDPNDEETAVSLASVGLARPSTQEGNCAAASGFPEDDGWDTSAENACDKREVGNGEEEGADARDSASPVEADEGEDGREERGGEGEHDGREEDRQDDAQTQTRSESPMAAPATLSTEAMDEYFRLCALEVLHAISDDQLPMDISALNSKIAAEAPPVYVEKLRVPGKPATFVAPDVRKTSHKKLVKFVQFLSKTKLLQTKETRGAVAMVKVNRSHPQFLEYKPLPEKTKKKILERVAAEEAAASASSPTSAGGEETGDRRQPGRAVAGESGAANGSDSGPLVLEFCTPPQKLTKVFHAVNVQTG
ncbi:translation initiation factor sui1 protein, partial [Toxoplasma gondii CAST]